MRRRRAAAWRMATVAATIVAASPAAGFDLPEPVSGWRAEVGTRAFFSGGRYQKSLYGRYLNSRLTYGGTRAVTGEVFGRLDMPGGVFVKGYAGFGSHTGGTLIDEDFPPGFTPYSRTVGEMRNGRIDYASLDVGGTVWQSGANRLGLFVGVHRFFEKYHAYGCRQTATSSMCVPTTPLSHLDMSQTARWTVLRVGAVADLAITDRLKVTLDAAFLPYAHLDAFDNHWNRPEINPTAEVGHGIGTQLEASLAYRLTDHLSLGAGGRFWYYQTAKAKARFGPPDPPERVWSERWGLFVQVSYRTAF
ncbi:hypothetical protein [Phreatobacter cathodiphilus]|nr:hypothetical protein [Phreatobacter cathodiphilus]